MPITQPGVGLSNRTPKESRPAASDPPQSMEEIGTTKASARVAADTTRWCRSCNVTVQTTKTSAFCPEHAADRNLYLKRVRRKARRREAREAERLAWSAVSPPTVVPEGKALVDLDALRHIARMADMMSIHVARASKHYQDLDRPVWLDNLMLSAKNLDAAIDSGLCNGDVLPMRRVQRVAARPRA